ncbi:hypothetical protein F4803DRAFT_545344 [Xylaria telfairii]|nr:hypothetical protein F4803DRAFT_545344 [Xylaria telfairii]
MASTDTSSASFTSSASRPDSVPDGETQRFEPPSPQLTSSSPSASGPDSSPGWRTQRSGPLLPADRKAINDAFQAIKNRFNGLLAAAEDQIFYFEDPSSFGDLQDKLADADLSGFVSEKVRFDWDADIGKLVLRMPTTIHEMFTRVVHKLLVRGLDRVVQEYEVLQPFRNKIGDDDAGDITYRDNNTYRLVFNKSPDVQFPYDNYADPPFIVEIAFSQTPKQISEKVYRYLTKLQGCTVLIFNLLYQPYSERKEGKSIYNGYIWLYTSTQPRKAKALVKNIMFQEKGRGVEGNIEIPFTFFIPYAERTNLPANAETANMRLNFADLTPTLSKGLTVQHSRNSCKRKRSLSPIQVDEGDGRMVQVKFTADKDGQVCQMDVEEDGNVEVFAVDRK